MLWVHGHYKYIYSYSAGIDFRRENLTSTDIRFSRLKLIPAPYGTGLTFTSANCKKILTLEVQSHFQPFNFVFKQENLK